MSLSRRSKKIVINNFSNLSSKSNTSTDSFYNYYPKADLYNSLGVAPAKFPKTRGASETFELDLSDLAGYNIKGVNYFKQYYSKQNALQHRLLIYGENKRLYIHQMIDGDLDIFWLYSLEFNSAPITLTFRKDDIDTIILASKDKMVIWRTGFSPYTVEDAPIITSMCYDEEKVIYCTIVEPAYKIWYAFDLSFESIGNISISSNYISLDDELGYARKILNFDENIYVFRDYGISKITRIGTKFSVDPVYSSNTLIYSNTISVCGNAVLFMTSDGLYSFNGVRVSKCDIDLSKMLTNLGGSEVASSLGDKYYLALRLDFQDGKEILCEANEHTNNAIIVVDMTDYSYQIIRGVDVGSFYPLRLDAFEKMLITFNSGYANRIGEIVSSAKCFDDALPKYWCSGLLTDTLNTKLFTKLSVVADKDVKFNLRHDGKDLCFTTYQDGYNEFSFKVVANCVRLEISSEAENGEVSEVNLDYYEY